MFVCPECGASQPNAASCPTDGAQLAPAAEDVLLGMTIGPYRVAHLLGIGGMGRVYKGVHPQIGSRVAIKVLSRECSDRRDLVERFFSEAKAVNLIRHESIVNVLDLATLPDGRPYIVMEYLDGAPLAAIIEHAQRTGPLPLGGIARLAAEVLDALGAAHAKGIVHRDLKPDNIFVTPAGRAKVLDFGIAKLQPELGGSATHTGSLLGTPHYMSPEQAAGRPVDARADIYAMGVILFECATLHKPFTADSLFDLLRKHVEAPPPSPRALRPDMPPDLEQVIFVALAKPPEQRFMSAHAMSMALQHATAQLPQGQWAPLTPAGRSPSSGGWAPTPPASWATRRRDAPGLASTATAGQVTETKLTASRKGLWIAIAAIVLVGGGVTAVIVGASGGDGKPSPTQVASNTTPTSEPPTPAPSTPPEPPAPKDEAMAEPDDDDTAGLIEGYLAAATPGQRAQLPSEFKAALAKYGSYAKFPKAVRARLAGTMLAGINSMAADPDITAALAADAPPVGGKAALGPDGWVTNTQLAANGNFDPAHLDAQSYLPFAIKQARQLIPDAELFRIDASGVFADGHADLTAVDNGSLDFRFISPSRSKRDPKLPIGAKQEKKCMFRIMVDKTGVTAMPMTGWECKDKLLPPPRCTFVAAWKRALAQKAPTNAIASLGYRANSDGVATWYFDITDEDSPFSTMFRDDC